MDLEKATVLSIVFWCFFYDLSKAFDILPHDMFFSKINAYGFDELLLQIMQSNLTNRRQRTTVNSRYISSEKALFGVPQVIF